MEVQEKGFSKVQGCSIYKPIHLEIALTKKILVLGIMDKWFTR